MKILAINGGSSSVKCRVDDLSSAPSEPSAPLWQAHAESLENLESVLRSAPPPDAVAHRIVQSGKYRRTMRIDADVMAAIASGSEEAPAHNKFELAAIDTARRVFGAEAPQVAVFDSTFHATLAPAAYVYPGPYEWLGHGIRRYGFHGLSHQYSSRRAAELLGPRIASVDCLPSGQWRLAMRDAEREKRRHDHGLYAARRPHDGDALGLGRSVDSHLPDSASGIQRGPSGRHS